MKLVILDRDGTINEDRDDFVKSPDEWVPIPGSLEAIARLNHAGWHVVVATNQSGLGARPVRHGDAERHPRQDEPRARPRSAAASTRSSSARTRPTTAATAASRCPACSRRSASATACRCARRAAVGDSLRDLQAGVAVGCAPHLVRTGKGALLDEAALRALQKAVPARVVHADLAAFAQH